jgi:tRNA 2-thiouridine synthesizing protein E
MVSLMGLVEYKNKVFDVDSEGFLTDPSQFSPEWVEYVQGLEEIDELTEDHQEVIKILRDFQEANGRPPRVRDMSELTGLKLKYIYELVPSGPGKGACKMAGLGKPDGCA